jgi:hypothetical protein
MIAKALTMPTRMAIVPPSESSRPTPDFSRPAPNQRQRLISPFKVDERQAARGRLEGLVRCVFIFTTSFHFTQV